MQNFNRQTVFPVLLLCLLMALACIPLLRRKDA